MRNDTKRQRVRQARKRLVYRDMFTVGKIVGGRLSEDTSPFSKGGDSMTKRQRVRVRQARKRLVCRWIKTACRNACTSLSHGIDSFNKACEKYEPTITNITYKTLALIGYLFICYKAWTF